MTVFLFLLPFSSSEWEYREVFKIIEVTDDTILTIDNDTMLDSWVLSIRAWT